MHAALNVHAAKGYKWLWSVYFSAVKLDICLKDIMLAIFRLCLLFLGALVPVFVLAATSTISPPTSSPATGDISTCPGYRASNIAKKASTLTADLTLRGPACDAYGYDLVDLKLVVEYQTCGLAYEIQQDMADWRKILAYTYRSMIVQSRSIRYGWLASDR